MTTSLSQQQRLGLLLLACGLVISLTACGPISYITQVTVTATRLTAEAETANAKQLAPYEYWSAKTYLHMARQKAGTADYELATTYGELATKMARKAIDVAADGRRAGPQVAPIGKEDEQPPSLKVVPATSQP
ncbi:MAG: DUF4398 domain-containing protein [Deltaproteobacteria bacterium]|nr:DUF4398 domain-containing protein [Deltaproteobacteria bacterium]